MAIIKIKLNPAPFAAIIEGTKTVEARLNDAKMKKINVGDTIIFTKEPENIEKIEVAVTNFYPCKTFLELFQKLGPECFRHKTEESFLKSIYSIYTKEQERKYGVLGIKVRLGFRHENNSQSPEN